MALRIDQTCDWCGNAAPVSLPKTGPLDLSKIPLPPEWEDFPSFPGGNVGEQDGQQLCTECKGDHPKALQAGEAARDKAYQAFVNKGKARSRGASSPAPAKALSSSFSR